MSDGVQPTPFVGKRVLHVGCGGSPLPAWFAGSIETRLDIDERHAPDVVCDMREISVRGFDVVFTNHALEHLYPQDVVPCLKGFKHALDDGGCAVVIVPDLHGIKPTFEMVYESPCGPITGHDMIYGHHKLIDENPYMAHHSGFVQQTLEQAFSEAGFASWKVHSDDSFNLIGVAVK